jgi:DNA-binding NarL/FixJ family response regulator
MDTRPLRVLIADDDARFRRALTEILAAVGHLELAGVARDGTEAIRMFSELAPDIVLMDVVMPGCDGIKATREIRAIDPEARIVALTEGDDYRALALCLAAGAKGCLKKDPATIRLLPLMVALQSARAAGSRATAPPGGAMSRAEDTTFDRRRSTMVLSYLLRARVCIPVLAVAVGATLTGCGGGSSGSDDKAATGPVFQPRAVSARLGEYKIQLDHADAPSGTVTFTIHNAGAIQHEFVVLRTDDTADGLPVKENEAQEKGAGTRMVDEAEDIDAGKTVKLSVKLKPGNYILICNLPGHYAGGMRAAFHVA